MENQHTPDPQQTVAGLVLDHSETASVFQRHRIDFCCRGDLSIEAAAREKGVDVAALLAELAKAISERTGDQGDPRGLATPMLVAYIVEKHHAYLRAALPFVRTLARKVARVHGAHNPRLLDLQPAVEALAATLTPHLEDEELVLFPALTAAHPDGPALASHFAVMSTEHEAVGALLACIRAAADDFALPAWACNSYRTLFAELESVERDVFVHVHLENHVLKPRFAA